MAEPLNATFFALKPRDRAVLLPATLSMAGIVLAIVALFIAVNWSAFSRLGDVFAMAGSNEVMSDQAAFAMMGAMFGLIGTTFLFLFPLYLVLAAYEAGCLRWMIRGEAPGLFGLTLNVDTWRVYSVFWFWFLANLAVSTAASIVTFPLLFLSIGQMPSPTGDPMEMMMWQLRMQAPVMLIQYGALAFVGVRFAPAAATSILRRRFSFFDAWKVTKDRFWELLGSFALLWLFLIILYIVVAGASFGLGMSAIWPAIQEMYSKPTQAALQHYWSVFFSPQILAAMAIGYAIMIVASLVYYVLSFGINARAAMAALEEGKIDAPAA
jgi:hypothetical protein